MFQVLRNTWALQLGVLLIMLGNGLQSTLLGIRGSIEGFSVSTMSFVMAAYFLGFLGGSRLAPKLIRRVGHVRVFAALGSLASAVLILYAIFPAPILWVVLRAVIGFCLSGVYVVAESWLNDGATNETRGKALSVYIIVQMIGIIAAQGIINLGDPGGYLLFAAASVFVSISFAPILLSVSPVPAFQASKPMTIKEFVKVSPLGAVGSFCLGALFAGLWGMGSVFGTEIGLSNREISIFVALMYIGGLVCQYPVGWMSDRVDRRRLILAMAAIGAVASLTGFAFSNILPLLFGAAFVIGGITNPLYSLIIAHANDFLETEDMAAGAGALIFINGFGAIGGPLLVGWMMEQLGPGGFFIYLLAITSLLAAFAFYRTTVRPALAPDLTSAFSPVSPSSSPVAVDMAQEWATDQQSEA